MCILLLKVIINIKVPNSNSRTCLFFREIEEIFLDSLNYLIKQISGSNYQCDLSIIITKTINSYTNLKDCEENFDKYIIIYTFTYENINNKDSEISVLSIESLCNLILIMNCDSLPKRRDDLPKVMLNMLMQIYPMLYDIREEHKYTIERGQLMNIKDKCIKTYNTIMKRLAQNGNLTKNYLEPMISYFENKNWIQYKIAKEIFIKIINDAEDSFGIEIVSIRQIYGELIDNLKKSIESKAAKEKIANILKVIKGISKCKQITIIGNYYKTVVL